MKRIKLFVRAAWMDVIIAAERVVIWWLGMKVAAYDWVLKKIRR